MSAAWAYVARTLELSLLAAFVAAVLALALLVIRARRFHVLRVGHDHRAAVVLAAAVATAQQGRRGAGWRAAA